MFDTDEHVVTLLAEHTILLPGRLPHINFHACVLHLKNIRTIVSSLQNLFGIHSLQQLAFRVCIMAITRAGAIAAAAKAGPVSSLVRMRKGIIQQQVHVNSMNANQRSDEVKNGRPI